MEYKLKSGLASFEGEEMGEKVWVTPMIKSKSEKALKEALECLAVQSSYIDELKEELRCFISSNYCGCGHPACSKELDNKCAEDLISRQL